MSMCGIREPLADFSLDSDTFEHETPVSQSAHAEQSNIHRKRGPGRVQVRAQVPCKFYAKGGESGSLFICTFDIRVSIMPVAPVDRQCLRWPARYAFLQDPESMVNLLCKLFVRNEIRSPYLIHYSSRK